MATDLYTVLSGIQVDANDITQATTFATQYLQPLYPDLDLRQGVALNDMVIRPFATLLAMLDKGLNYYFSNNTIAGITDASPSDIVDNILSNFFVTRNQGQASIIHARLYFLTNNRDIYIASTNSFSMDNAVFFNPVSDVLITASSLQYDSSLAEYYYDVDLISTTASTSANLSSGTFIYHSQVDPYFLQANILYLVQEAIAPETNTQFIARAKTAISTRNLINNPSIISLVTSTFNYFTHVLPVGYGDAEMLRDQVQFINPVDHVTADTIHVGGKVDVYVNDKNTMNVVQFTTDASGNIYIPANGGSTSYVIYNVVRATAGDLVANSLTDAIGLAVPFTVTYGSGTGASNFLPMGNFEVISSGSNSGDYNDVGFSQMQCTKIAFGGGYPNQTASFELYTFPNVVNLQNFLDDTSHRVICGDYLGRAMNNYAIDINIRHINGQLLNSVEIEAAQTALQTYFDTLVPGQTLVTSLLLQVIIDQAQISNLDSNPTITYTLFDRTFQYNAGAPGSTGTVTSFMPIERTAIFVLRNVTSV